MKKLLYKISLFFKRKSKEMYVGPDGKLKYATPEEGIFKVTSIAEIHYQHGAKIIKSVHFLGKKVKA